MTFDQKLIRILLVFPMVLGSYECYRLSTLPEEGIAVRDVPSGLYVLYANAVATNAGLQVGDTIVSIDGQQLTSSGPQNFRWRLLDLAASAVGSPMSKTLEANALL